MIKTLIPVDTDLGSSIALRYVEDLLNHIPMELYDIHVVESSKIGSSPGSGWVQKTWENAILDTAAEKIRKFLEMEKINQPLLNNPRVIIGERDTCLLDELHAEQYDLFIEGALPNFDPKIFFSVLNSKLYRLMPCPVLLVKNLLPFEKIAFVAEKGSETKDDLDWFANFLENFQGAIDFLRVKPVKFQTLDVKDTDPGTSHFEAWEKIISKTGLTLNACKEIEGPVKNIADLFREYGLVMTTLRHKPNKNDHLVQLLGHIAPPILISWR